MSSMYRPSGPAQAGRRPCFPKLGYVLGLGLIESRVWLYRVQGLKGFRELGKRFKLVAWVLGVRNSV